MATLPGLVDLLKTAVDMGASDLHLSIDSPPQRIFGSVVVSSSESRVVAWSEPDWDRLRDTSE